MRERFPRLFDAFIWPAVVCADAAILLIFVSAGFLARWRLGASEADLAYVGGAYWLLYIPMAPLAARLGSRIGLRRVSLGGAIVLLAAALCLTQTQGFWQLVAAVGLLGVGASGMWPNIEAELSRGREGAPLRRRLSIFNMVWSAGLAVGPLIGALVYPDKAEATGPGGRAAVNAAFHAAALLAAGLVACLALWRCRVPPRDEIDQHAAAEGPRDPVRLRAFWLMAFVANFMCYIVLAVLRHLYERLADAEWPGAVAAQRHQVLLGALAAASVVTFAVLYVAHRWHYRLKRHLAWQVLMAGALVLVALTASYGWSAVGFVLIGCGTAAIYSGSLFYSIEGHDETSHMAGWHEAVIGLGSLSGLLLTGHVPELLGRLGVSSQYWLLRSPYLAAAGLFGLGIVAQLVIYARHARGFAGRV